MSEQDEYTPTTRRVRDAYAGDYEYRSGMPGNHLAKYPDEVLAQFDRWLSDHDAEVAAVEHEACAKIAGELYGACFGNANRYVQVVAQRIRVRGEGGSENG